MGAADAPAAGSRGLRRELHFWEAIALSIGIMAPTAAMALNGTAPAALIGRAVPLAFIFATIGVLFVSYAFIRLSRYFSHAGSVFAGFEGAAALREETDNPRRQIPRAIRNAVVGCGVFYILCILVQTWGFGATAAGAKAFAGSTAPLGALANSYVGSAMSDAINFGATISAFASGLGATAAGARILFALSRHTPVERALGTTSTRTGAPAGALVVVLAVGVGAIAVQRIAGVSAVNAFFYPGTLGVLSLLVAYILTNLGAIRYLFIAARRAPVWEIVFPLAGIAFLIYTIYKNVQGVPFPYDRFPLAVGIWLAIGLVIALATPTLARRIGATLVRDAGLDDAPEATSVPT